MKSKLLSKTLSVFLTLAVNSTVVAAQTNSSCGNPFQNHFGPFDYRTVDAQNKNIVERIHFTPGVESLILPATTTFNRMAQDIAYTLHVFPNHHRALLAMSKAAAKFGSDPAPGARFTVTCYFERAILFRPDDTVARLLYAQYLGKANRKEEALAHVRRALHSAGDNPFSHYNIGLLALELGDFALAVEQARIAQSMGYTASALEDGLRAKGQWPTTTADPAASRAEAAPPTH